MATFSSSSISSMLFEGLNEPRVEPLPVGVPKGNGSTLHSCFFFSATPLALILWPNVSAVKYLYWPLTRPTVPDHILTAADGYLQKKDHHLTQDGFKFKFSA